MSHLSVEGEKLVERPYDEVFENLLRTLPRSGFRLGLCDRDNGLVRARPQHSATDAGVGEIRLRLQQVSDRQIWIDTQIQLLRFENAARIAAIEHLIRRLLVDVARPGVRATGPPWADLTDPLLEPPHP
ncbi:MAG: hypothetical protein ACT4QA_02190 [Panacagrimonas sp.]